MKGKSAISAWQLAGLLFISRVLQFFLATPQKGDLPGGVTAALWLPVSILTVGLLLMPAFFLFRKNKGHGILDLAYERWGGGGAVVPLLFFLVSICIVIQTVCSFSYFLTSTVYPETSPWLFILLLMAVGGYAAAMGYEPVARFGGFVLISFLIMAAFVGIVLLPEAQWELLLPPVYDSAEKQGAIWLNLSLNNLEVIALLFMLPTVNGKKQGVFWKWSILSFVFLEGLFLLATAVLGDYAATQRFPFYAMTKIAEISILQRLDSLHVALWVFMALVRLALYLGVAGKSLARLLPEKASKYAVLSSAVAAALAAGIFTGLPKALQGISWVLNSGIPVLVLGFVTPVLLLLSPARKKG